VRGAGGLVLTYLFSETGLMVFGAVLPHGTCQRFKLEVLGALVVRDLFGAWIVR
jgi:hypothetical protein